MRGTALLLAVVTLGFAAACSSTGSRAEASRVEKPDLTVAVVPAVDSAGFFVALYEGLFKAQGLNVKFVPAISSETAIANQVSGQYDITCGNYVSYIQAQQSHQADLYILAEGSTLQPGVVSIYTRPGSPIRTVEELKGRTIAINAPKNILYLLAASTLAEHGVSLADVHFTVAKNGFPAMPAELTADAFDAAVIAEPFGSVAEEAAGAVPLADLNEGATAGFPIEGYAVTKQWARKYPRTLAAFYKALEEGQEIAGTNRAVLETSLEHLLGLSRQTTAIMSASAFPVGSGPVGTVDKIRLQRVVNLMQQFIGFPAFNIDSMLMRG
jgi:NitT/TauT family transport system substrate-binding protein